MKSLILLCLLFAGCGTLAVTDTQAIAIATPLVSGGLALVLRNNPTYLPIALKVGNDLSTANYSDLTLTGINVAVNAAVKKEGGDPILATLLSSALDAGLAGYLEAVGEASLSKDPYAQTVLQALGGAISTGAALAQANPKP
jgi:hypothetical protein